MLKQALTRWCQKCHMEWSQMSLKLQVKVTQAQGYNVTHKSYNDSSKVWVFRPRFLYFLMTSWRDLSCAKSN